MYKIALCQNYRIQLFETIVKTSSYLNFKYGDENEQVCQFFVTECDMLDILLQVVQIEPVIHRLMG